jgi:hypothetical protein
VAKQNGWSVELTWRGFRSPETRAVMKEFEPAVEAGLLMAMKGVVRRFESRTNG